MVIVNKLLSHLWVLNIGFRHMQNTEDTKPKTKHEMAVHFGVTTRTIDLWMKQGLLPYWKLGHLVRFDLAAVTARLNQKALKNGGKAK